MQACSCRICNQHRAPSPARGSGFKSDTTRTNHARTGVIGFCSSWPRLCQARSVEIFLVYFGLLTHPPAHRLSG